jgi:O-antigen/teichoic acid export membrane protein
MMSRKRKALIASTFSYVQWVLTALVGLFLTRFLIRTIGQELYGTWLATGALLAYATLADLGILGVMPWLFAEADGAKDSARMRSLLGHGLAASLVGGLVYFGLALCLWLVIPGMLHLSATDREELRGPVLAMVTVISIGYPLRLFAALRLGLQDYSFMGTVGVMQTLLNLAFVLALTLLGFALYGIALGAAVPGVLAGAAALGRTVKRDRALFTGWPALRLSALRPIITSGAGQWLGSLGWQLASASDAVVLAYLGYRGLVPMFVVTSRLGLTLMQLSWMVPDSTSVGLAQLNAEGQEQRTTDVIRSLLRFHLLAAGLVACGCLAGNFGFVSAWVGQDLYGGDRLNATIALSVVALSAVHGLMVPVAVLGRRMTTGLLTLLNGAVHIILALAFGRVWALTGVALATVVSTLVTTIPAGLAILTAQTRLKLREVVTGIVLPWLLRAIPCAAIAATFGWSIMRSNVAGRIGSHGALLAGLVAGTIAGGTYLLGMRPIMRELPFGPRLRRALGTLRLV